MHSLAEIWVYLEEQPLLWLTVTVGIFWLCQQIYRMAGEFPLLNPVLVSVIAIVSSVPMLAMPR